MAGFSKEGKWHRKFESVNDVQIQPDLDKLEKTRKISKKLQKSYCFSGLN
jgi:hypothetical protein